MSARRRKALFQEEWYTIFIMGLNSRSLPVLVTDDTTIGEIYEHLRYTSLTADVGSAGPKLLDHWALEHFHISICTSLFLAALPGNTQPARTHGKSRMEEVLAAEHLDEFGMPENPRSKRAAPRKRKAKPVNTDSEDEDFGGGDDDSDSDSEIEVVLSNEEVADSLPSRTLPKNTERAGKPRPKKRPKKNPAAAPAISPSPVASTSTSTAAPATTPPVTRPSDKKQRKGGGRTPIHFFFEDVTAAADGSVEEGAQYHKCYLGNKDIICITAGSRHDTAKLKKHLMATSKPHFRLWQVLDRRKAPATDFLFGHGVMGSTYS
ncbi:hypothetical protein B0H15DRAFT_804195 [Mycena belliarum]|uniref:Uncharacterized protein n=1 Tax=Mycena belliarum TaxID=1033014 RepID=A0AAD6U028_9AGAR|nr:hypothetical protein B0H15DRAFT_804195 [Mycena belliae]